MKIKKTLPVLLIVFVLSGCGSSAFELSGTVRSTQTDIASEVSGKVLSMEIEEGSPVKKGDIIAILDSSMQELVVVQQEAIVRMKEAKLEELMAGTRTEQLDQYRASVKTAEAAKSNARTGIDTAQTDLDYWRGKYDVAKEAYDSAIISKSALDDAKLKFDTARQRLDAAKKQHQSSSAQLDAARAQLSLLEKGSTSQTIAAAEADLAQSRAVLEQAKLVLSKYEIKSPADGTFIQKNVEPGTMINAGAYIGTVSDLSDLWMYVYVRQKHLKYVNIGQEVSLTGDATGDKSIKGKITFISDEAEFTPKNVQTDEARDNTVFKVRIDILSDKPGIKPGMTFDTLIPMK